MSEHRTPAGECPGDAAAYVLGALTETEHVAFLEHLSSCAVCREEVAALATVAAALPAAAPSRAAPPALKERVMAEVHAAARELRASPLGETARRDRSARARVLVPLAAALSVIAVALAIVLSGGGSATRVVRAEVLAAGASGYVRISGSHAELNLRGMPQPSHGRVYELWIKRGGGPEPTDALFTVGSGGRASVGVPGGVAGVRVLMVTSEPLGGSPAPTRPPSVVARLG